MCTVSAGFNLIDSLDEHITLNIQFHWQFNFTSSTCLPLRPLRTFSPLDGSPCVVSTSLNSNAKLLWNKYTLNLTYTRLFSCDDRSWIIITHFKIKFKLIFFAHLKALITICATFQLQAAHWPNFAVNWKCLFCRICPQMNIWQYLHIHTMKYR